jgi:hypothetical protein
MSVYKFHPGAVYRNCVRTILWVALCFVCSLIYQPQATAAQVTAAQATPGASEAQAAIGRLSGDDVSVKGAISFETENGRTTALLASGSDLTLRSGEAKIDLPEGGEIVLCGPAHLSILKSGLKSGAAITIALDYGQVHLRVSGTAQLTVYSPLLIVTPAPIGTRDIDLTIGLDQKGELCVMAFSGAVRMQEQFSGESTVVPQGGDVQIEGGELRTLRSGARTCSCELLVSQNNPRREMETIVTRGSPNAPGAVRSPESATSPVYRIEVPLAFDASSAAGQMGLSLQAVQIIRESVVQQPVSFRGAVKPALPAPPAQIYVPVHRPHHSTFGFFTKIFGMFHHHRSSGSEQSAEIRP